MSDKSEFLDMLRKMAEMSDEGGGLDNLKKEVQGYLDTFMDKKTRIEMHQMLIRQSMSSVLLYVMSTMGPKHSSKVGEAVKHLKACTDIVVENNRWDDTDKMPGNSLLFAMRPIMTKKEEDGE